MNRNYIGLVLLLLLHGGFLFLYKFTAWPEMLAYPWLMQQGFSLYGDIIHPYPPLLPLILLMLFSVIGFSVQALLIITVSFTVVIDLLIFLIARQMYNQKLALVAVATFIPLHIFFEGNGLWFDIASVPFILAAIYILLVPKQSLFLTSISGCFFGLAILTKQTNIVFLLPAILLINLQANRIVALVFGTVATVLIPVVFYATSSHVQDFYYWAFVHPLFIHARMPGLKLLPTFKQVLIIGALFSPLIFVKKNRIVVLYFVLSLCFMFPRFAYFHLIPAATFFSLLFPQVIADLKVNKKIFFSVYLLIFLRLFIPFSLREMNQPIRFFEPKILEIRNALTKQIPHGKTVYFYNVPANYFVTLPFTQIKPWADIFPWYLEVAGVQEKIIKNLDTADYVVHKPFLQTGEYDLGAYVPQKINKYILDNFQMHERVSDQLYILKRSTLQ